MEVCGIYTNLRPVCRRQSDGHMLYDAECSVCGKTFRRAKSDFKRNKQCRHAVLPTKISSQRLRRIFRGMKQRCYCVTDKDYDIYGGKGVRIADNWLESPELFEEWSLCHGYADDLTIDRIDPDGDYDPQNCRWISLTENAKYKSTTHTMSVHGIEHTGRDWSKICGLGENTINKYLATHEEGEVIEFIDYVLDHGLPDRTRKNQSYIDTYLQSSLLDFGDVTYASVAQLAEHLPSKQDVADSDSVTRSIGV